MKQEKEKTIKPTVSVYVPEGSKKEDDEAVLSIILEDEKKHKFTAK